MSYLKQKHEELVIDQHNNKQGKIISNFDTYYLFYELVALSEIVSLTLIGKIIHVNVHDTRKNILKCLPDYFINSTSHMHTFNALFNNRECIYAKLYMMYGKYNIYIDGNCHVFSAPSRINMCELPYNWYRCRY